MFRSIVELIRELKAGKEELSFSTGRVAQPAAVTAVQWQELEGLLKHSVIRSITFRNVDFSHEQLAGYGSSMLKLILANPHLRYLRFSIVRFSQDQERQLNSWFAQSQSLKTLYLFDTDLSALLPCVAVIPHLEEIILSNDNQHRALLIAFIQQCRLPKIQLIGMDLGDDFIPALTQMMRDNRNIETLDVSVNKLGRVSATGTRRFPLFATALEQCRSLKVLDLSCTSLDENDVLLLVTTLYSLPALEKLNLDNCGELRIGAVTQLSQYIAQSKSLKTLVLSRNGMSNHELVALVNGLEKNSSVTSLDLSSNNFGEENIKALARLLTTNTSITELNLNECMLSSRQSRLLARAFCCNNTLRALHLRNAQTGAEFLRALRKNTHNKSMPLVAVTMSSLMNHANGEELAASFGGWSDGSLLALRLHGGAMASARGIESLQALELEGESHFALNSSLMQNLPACNQLISLQEEFGSDTRTSGSKLDQTVAKNAAAFVSNITIHLNAYHDVLQKRAMPSDEFQPIAFVELAKKMLRIGFSIQVARNTQVSHSINSSQLEALHQQWIYLLIKFCCTFLDDRMDGETLEDPNPLLTTVVLLIAQLHPKTALYDQAISLIAQYCLRRSADQTLTPQQKKSFLLSAFHFFDVLPNSTASYLLCNDLLKDEMSNTAKITAVRTIVDAQALRVPATRDADIYGAANCVEANLPHIARLEFAKTIDAALQTHSRLQSALLALRALAIDEEVVVITPEQIAELGLITSIREFCNAGYGQLLLGSDSCTPQTVETFIHAARCHPKTTARSFELFPTTLVVTQSETAEVKDELVSNPLYEQVEVTNCNLLYASFLVLLKDIASTSIDIVTINDTRLDFSLDNQHAEEQLLRRKPTSRRRAEEDDDDENDLAFKRITLSNINFVGLSPDAACTRLLKTKFASELTSLSIRNCKLTTFFSSLPKGLVELDLSQNPLTHADQDMKKFAGSLSSLKKLQLENCTLGDDGVRGVIELLVNHEIKNVTLDLRRNAITDIGAKNLLNALEVSNAISVSLEGNSISDELLAEIDARIRANREIYADQLRTKLFTSLISECNYLLNRQFSLFSGETKRSAVTALKNFLTGDNSVDLNLYRSEYRELHLLKDFIDRGIAVEIWDREIKTVEEFLDQLIRVAPSSATATR